ncbi:MAG: signal peptidase I [Firmicutes bacterium]|nr:signal peptidase I [Bacillota bacterium]
MAQDETKQAESRSSFRVVYDWVDSIVLALVVVALLFVFVFRMVGIRGNSMKNTYFDGDRVIISNLFYEPKCGDVVVISRNASNEAADENEGNVPIIKRIIATSGQTVDINFETHEVSVDGNLLKEDYILEPTALSYDVQFPVVVPDGHVFVLGDNRNDSLDSRSTLIGDEGMVDTRYILGRAVFRVMSPGGGKLGKVE